jgi:hypothetical protein
MDLARSQVARSDAKPIVRFLKDPQKTPKEEDTGIPNWLASKASPRLCTDLSRTSPFDPWL